MPAMMQVKITSIEKSSRWLPILHCGYGYLNLDCFKEMSCTSDVDSHSFSICFSGSNNLNSRNIFKQLFLLSTLQPLDEQKLIKKETRCQISSIS